MQRKNRPQNAKTGKSSFRWLWIVISYGIGAACIYWVFHDISFSEVLHSMSRINGWYISLAAVLELLVYACAGYEWQILLRPTARLPFHKTTQAILAGRFANDILPVHAGYIVRVYLVSLWGRVSIPAVIPSFLIERLFDSTWLAICIGLTIPFFPMPQEFVRLGEELGGAILVGVAVLAWLILRKRKHFDEHPPEGKSHWKIIQKFRTWTQQIIGGLHTLGNSRLLFIAMGLSILKLLIQCLAFLLLLWAYGFTLPFWVQLAVFLIAYVGISLPSTPASMGVFQLFCVAGLQLFGIQKAPASAFALLAFLVLTVPLSIAGFIAINHSGITLRHIRTEIGRISEVFGGR